MEIYVKKHFYFLTYSFFWFLIMILSYTLIFTHVAASSTATDDVTNWVTHINLLQTHNLFVLILYSKLMRNVATLAIFNTIK